MYNGNALLRNKGEKVYMSKKRVQEYIRCKEDILYFAENYFSIVTIDKGKIIIPLHDYQKKMLKAFLEPPKNKRHCCVLSARQSGKCVLNNSSIVLRNKKTGKIKKTNIGQFFKNQKDQIQ